jgi:DNA-binding NtrC family response regulator/tetratricopeptide (TPR) repeat protein
MRPEKAPQFPRTESRPPTVEGRGSSNGMVARLFGEARRHYLKGDVDRALRTLNRLFNLDNNLRGRRTPPVASLRDAALLRGWCLIESRQHEQCRQWLKEARNQGFLFQDDRGAAVLEMNLLLFEEQYATVQDRAEQMLATSDGPPTLVLAELHLCLGAAQRWQGNTRDAVGHVEHACLAFGFLQEPGREAVAANFLGWTHLSMGHLEEARRWFEKSRQINSGLGATLRLAQNYQNLAIVCYKQGQYELAAELLEKELALLGGQADMKCRARIAMGNVKRLQGDFMDARKNLLEAFALAEEAGLVREQALALEFLGDVFRDEGQVQEAGRYYERSLVLARKLAPRGDLVMELMRREGECLDLAGRHDEALHLLNDALQLCREVGDRFETAITLRCLGVNATNLGRWSQGVDHLRSSLEALSALGARHECMLTRFHLAQVLQRQIDTGNAGSGSERLLEEAWKMALAAQQTRDELGRGPLGAEIDGLVTGLARRKFAGQEANPRPAVFSTLRAPASRVVATSPAMQEVLRRCDGFAGYDNPVLISGESGTGKELLARRIHEISPRSSQPFIRVTCSASSPSVLAREIFGQVAGREDGPTFLPGLLAQAEGGTLLLSGIDELPLQIQDKLLRLFQEQVFRAEGDARDRRCNVRIIATTREDLGSLVAQGRFRANLHFRLRLMAVPVPPMRLRPEDLVPLLEHFLTRLEGQALRARSLFDFQALEAMAIHKWPGNVAEVEAIAQQAWVNRNLGRPVVLRRVEGPMGASLEFGTEREMSGATAAGHAMAEQTRRSSHPSGMTWSALMALIERADGNKSKVAKHLGISRITLYRWLEQLAPK